MKIQKIEDLTNETTEQLISLLSSSFIDPEYFKFVYYKGKNEEGVDGLYFELYSKEYGKIYQKSVDMKSHETISDVEEPFMTKIINEFIVNAIVLSNYNKSKKDRESKITELQENGILLYLN